MPHLSCSQHAKPDAWWLFPILPLCSAMGDKITTNQLTNTLVSAKTSWNLNAFVKRSVCFALFPWTDLIVSLEKRGLEKEKILDRDKMSNAYLLTAGPPDFLHLFIPALNLLGVALSLPLHLHLKPQLSLSTRWGDTHNNSWYKYPGKKMH